MTNRYTKPVPDGVITDSVKARYWARVTPNPEHGITLPDGTFSPCLDWQGYIDPDGYGRLNVTGWGNKGAHQVGYIIEHGEACPPGKVLDHQCNRECCANGLHVKPATQYYNILRGGSCVAPRMRRKARPDDWSGPID